MAHQFASLVGITGQKRSKKDGLTAAAFKVDSAGATAARAVGEAIKNDPQAVFLTMLSQSAVPVIREIKKTTSHSQLHTFSPVDTTFVQKAPGTAAAAAGASTLQIVAILQVGRLAEGAACKPGRHSATQRPYQ
jgi:hypothetical protein